jgi:hypothetical protein
MDLREIELGGMDWIDLAEDRDQWKALVNTVMNLRVPQNFGKFLRAVRLVASQKWLSSMELVRLGFQDRVSISLSYIYISIIFLYAFEGASVALRCKTVDPVS